ncbi:MAG: HAD-IC family P-type ATPase [Clostridiales bacterium]|jgi:cation-transporting ATPase E|nr:HAD-IC family P-type ATPase [Clostridiales bacterium]
MNENETEKKQKPKKMPAPAPADEETADRAALEKAADEVADRLAKIAENEAKETAPPRGRKRAAADVTEVVLEKHEHIAPQNIAKTEAQIEAEGKLAHDPEMQDLIDKVMADEGKADARLSVARKKNKKDAEFTQKVQTAERYYEVGTKDGLTLKQVAERTAAGLVNKTTSGNAKTYGAIFFQNLVTFFNLLCIVVAAALIATRNADNLFFLIIMAINTIISIVLEILAKKTIDKLSLISAPSAVVIRGGERANVPLNEVVLDDVIYLENGKQIGADCVVLSGEVEVNEALLTGESVPVGKKEGAALYGGSFVISGSCYARVDKIGSMNYIESLSAFAKRYRKPNSEILNSLKLFIMVVGIAIVPLGIFLFLKNWNMLGTGDLLSDLGNKGLKIVPVTAGAIIGMIPSGMFLLTSIALSMSVMKLKKNNVLVQDLYCIEMLARVNVLCLDKTGTITDGTMTVNEIIEFKNNNDTEYSLGNIVGSLLTATGDNNQTAVALINNFGYSKVLKPTAVLPFSSQRKFSAATFENFGTVILGAPEYIIRDMGVRLETLVNEKAKDGFRMVMIALAQGEIKNDKVPAQRKPLALIAIEDHIRDDAVPTLNWFRENGVAIKIISGDNPVTVSEVARRVGIEGAEKYVSLAGLTDPEVVELANQYTVFGRVTPEQKRLLIKSIKAQGSNVAMTGDGVNDILAMKEADCAVAIASGSEAARNVAHMVLMDSNFANMPAVVHEGRRVINNIQKSSSLFLMKTFFSILLTLFVLFLPDLSYPLTPKSMMPLEMFIIGAPSMALAFQSNGNRVSGKFLSNILKNALPSGLALILCFLSLYVINKAHPLFTDQAQFSTAVMLAVTFSGAVLLFRVCLPADYYRVIVWLLATVVCILCVIFFQGFFEVSTLSFEQMLLVILIAESSYALVAVLQTLLSRMKVTG